MGMASRSSVIFLDKNLDMAVDGRSIILPMIRLLVEWLLNALALLIVTYVVPGFDVEDFSTALVAVLVIGLLNLTLGWILRFVTWPLNWLTLGLVYLVVDAVIIYLASKLVKGFRIASFFTAFLGALVLAIVHFLFGLIG
jgi:putative membrane protein